MHWYQLQGGFAVSSALRQPRHNSITVAQLCSAISEGRLPTTISDGYYIFPKREAIRILRGVAQPHTLPYRASASRNPQVTLPSPPPAEQQQAVGELRYASLEWTSLPLIEHYQAMLGMLGQERSDE
jgi:hypothetical protein